MHVLPVERLEGKLTAGRAEERWLRTKALVGKSSVKSCGTAAGSAPCSIRPYLFLWEPGSAAVVRMWGNNVGKRTPLVARVGMCRCA
eukprot:366413-Chlamydomonas_euryale.AAC.17